VNSRRTFVAAVCLTLAVAGCSKKDDAAAPPSTENKKPAVDEQSDANGKTLTPDEKRYVEAAKPFVQAMADRKYDKAYAMLSSYAKARMSLSQFVPPGDDATAKQNEENPLHDISVEKFAELMKPAEARYGTPHAIRELYLFSSDPKALAPEKREGLDALDAMFAIGMMPDTVPKELRRASLRGKINTRLSADQLAQEAKVENTTVEELQKDPDFAPYFTIKTVMIEEGGKLSVGYFELLPPGIMD